MKNIKNLLAVVLALTIVLCLCACGNDENGNTEPDTSSTTTESKPQATEPQGTEPDDEKDPEPVEFVYTVVVKDTAGNPIAGVPVQICAGASCVPKVTDANGIAGYDAEISGDDVLTAKLIKVPEGYTAEVTEMEMEGVDSVEFVLQAENSSEAEELTYTIVVMERDDNPHTGLKVQITDEAGNMIEGFTDENGEALFSADDVATLVEGTHTASITELPENFDYYECEDEVVVDAENNVAFFVVISNT